MNRELSQEELRHELTHLDRSNGWGISEYRSGLFVTKGKLTAEIMALANTHGNFPIGAEPDSDFDFIITKNGDGSFTYGYCMEISNLNYKKFFDEPTSLARCANRLVSDLFKNHINKIKVVS